MRLQLCYNCRMKSGTVLIIGRPNVGKSTFVNNLIGQKVAITSPKPQTTRTPIHALYSEDRGEIIFVDTPGIFDKTKDLLSKKINQKTQGATERGIDAVLYMIDHTRRRNFEEAKVLGIVRKIDKPKILVINKIDIESPTYYPQYRFLEDEFDTTFKISGLHKTHVKPLMDKLFSLIPDIKSDKKHRDITYPLLNMDSKMFIGELIREKVFLYTRKEVPYTTTVLVDEITERPNGVTYIKAQIITTSDRYKKMLIGASGTKIKELGSLARKEIELATNKKIFLDLTVVTDPHWQEVYYS